MTKRSFWSLLAISAAALFVLPGCSGQPTGTASGKVTYQGAPVTEGNITFIGTAQGDVAGGAIKSDGSYTVSSSKGGLPPGTYKVVITPPEVEIPSEGDTPGSTGYKEMENIPEKYRSDATTDLEATVAEGTNKLDFDMK